MLELHLHGGVSVTSSVLEALGSLPDFRMSYKGEFTRRSYENNKMNLLEVEALSDLVNADTDEQRVLARSQHRERAEPNDEYEGWFMGRIIGVGRVPNTYEILFDELDENKDGRVTHHDAHELPSSVIRGLLTQLVHYKSLLLINVLATAGWH